MSAQIFGPTRQVRDSGAPGETTPTLLDTTRIKPPRSLFTSERTNLQAPDSRTDVIIECWAFGIAAKLTADMWFVHDGVRYDIIGKNDVNADYRKQTVKYQCRICNNPVI